MRIARVMVALAAFTSLALAAPITDLSSIGLYNTGTAGEGIADAHFLLNGTVSSWGVLSASFPKAMAPTVVNDWLANTSTSRWIGPQANLAGIFITPGDPNVPYNYQLVSLSLAGYIPSSVSITGRWLADNCGSILVGGTQVAGTGLSCPDSTNHYVWKPFTIPVGSFTTGTSVLTFRVENVSDVPFGLTDPPTNWTGLRVEFLTAEGTPSAIPEPGTMALFGGGLIGLAFWARRRK